MNAPMTNLQIYLTVGVLGLTLLIVIGTLLDFLHHKALLGRFDQRDAMLDALESRLEAQLDIR
jgi:hypothetical protein